MLDINFIRENPDAVRKAAKDKGFTDNVDEVLAADEERRSAIAEVESLRRQRNENTAAIKSTPGRPPQELIDAGKQLKEQIATSEDSLREIQERFDRLMGFVCNVPLPEVPVGHGEEDNVELRKWGTPPEFDFEPRDHEALGELLGIIDKPSAIKFAGSRSYLLRGAGALLELAIMRYALDLLAEEGFEPVLGPLMVNPEAMHGTGFFPYGEEDQYHLEKDGKYLVGTSEVFLVSMNRDEIIDHGELPRKFAGWSSCFRREAGSAGKDTRGVYRVHQFSKVEQVIICKNDPEESRRHHMALLNNAETLLQNLGIPYRVALACTGEIGLGQVLKHEVESWMPSRNAYNETHSCSSLYDYQARRSGIRFRDENGQIQTCYTLNNTMVASPRILIPILENFQNADGSVTVPEVLRPYMNGLERIEPK